MPLRVSTISFLNPAPLLYNFEHEPTASALRRHYDVHYTTPAICAAELNSGTADLGLIPIASLNPDLAIVPGCVIASLDEVRSILLLVKNPDWLPPSEALKRVRTVATDTASRSSVAYARILFEHFHHTYPTYIDIPADPTTMLPVSDAALLIGDPALLAREHRNEIDDVSRTPLLWLDLAHIWRELTGLPWVAAVWAVRPESLSTPHNRRDAPTAQQLVADLISSRDAGLANTEQLVAEWTPKLGLSADTIRTYLRDNIHYTLNSDCLKAIQRFRALAAGINALPPLPELNLL